MKIIKIGSMILVLVLFLTTFTNAFAADIVQNRNYIDYTKTATLINNSDMISRMNCYAYALQMFYNGTLPYTIYVPGYGNYTDYYYKQQPGEFKSRLSTDTYWNIIASHPYSHEDIFNKMKNDFSRLGFTIEKTTKTATVPAGKRKIMLAVDPEYDYHFYFRNSDGIWSHKIGQSNVYNTASDGLTVLNDTNIDTTVKKYGVVDYNRTLETFYLISKPAVWDFTNGNAITCTGSTPFVNATEQAGDIINSAQTVTLSSTSTNNGSISSSFCFGYGNAYGDEDYYMFKPSYSGNYKIYTTGATSSCDTIGKLYTSTGSYLTSDDDISYPSNRNFKIVFSLTANRTYFVKVSEVGSNGTGNYTLYIKRQ